uniref:Uncharacterized protein n=1 Tax=Lactuca sativa TaxID=4236 RepID=A0A9R1WWR0_LACSA|nr:hypothetical protein LSAT_V11C800400880 [Lactuca sativa]
MVRYNIMTSNSLESFNALSRDSRKLSITMLIDFFRATMQQCWCQWRNVGGTEISTLQCIGVIVFHMETYRSTYTEVAFHVLVPAEYEEPNEFMDVLPPLMAKRQVGRPKNHNRIPS